MYIMCGERSPNRIIYIVFTNLWQTAAAQITETFHTDTHTPEMYLNIGTRSVWFVFFFWDFVQSRKFQSRSWQLFNVSLRWVRFLINSISIFFGLSANLNFVQKCVQVQYWNGQFCLRVNIRKKRTRNNLYVIEAIAACRSKFSACTGGKNKRWLTIFQVL